MVGVETQMHYQESQLYFKIKKKKKINNINGAFKEQNNGVCQ